MKNKTYRTKEEALNSIKGWLNFAHTSRSFNWVVNWERIEIKFSFDYGILYKAGRVLYSIAIEQNMDGFKVIYGTDYSLSMSYADFINQAEKEGKIALTKRMKSEVSK